MRRLGAVFVTAVAAIAATVVFAPSAGADPPGPTDYRSVVVAEEPPTPAIEARIVGGDSFIELVVRRGHRVTVLGYRAEPYLRFRSDGRVEENERSPSRYLNRSRFGEVAVPSSADPAAAPRWRLIGSGGRWAWHDHRTHWMSSEAPLGHRRGDRILDAAVPLRVDGSTVNIRVIATWAHRPSLLPAGFGVAVALVAAWTGFRRPRWMFAVLLLGALAALVAGGWEVWSLPAETGPSPMLWVLPLVAAVLAAVAAMRDRDSGPRGTGPLTAAACLVCWASLRLATMWRPILPTSAPFALDRLLTGFTTAIAVVALAGGLVRLARSQRRRPQRSERM